MFCLFAKEIPITEIFLTTSRAEDRGYGQIWDNINGLIINQRSDPTDIMGVRIDV